jgi:hypothetical protein
MSATIVLGRERAKSKGGREMASVVNLNRFRKAKQRAEGERLAAENRAASGRTKVERRKAESERERLARELDSKRIE